MNLTRQEILAIAKKHNMEYVHETFLMRFVEDLIATELLKRDLLRVIEDE